MQKPSKEECISFLQNELDWAKKSGLDTKEYARKRITFFKTIKELLEKDIDKKGSQ